MVKNLFLASRNVSVRWKPISFPMTSSNFTYLENEFPLLYNLAQAAEYNLHRDAVTSLFKLRQFGEKLSELLFEEHHLEFPRENTFHNRLRTLGFEGVLPAAVRDLLFAIKQKGSWTIRKIKVSPP